MNGSNYDPFALFEQMFKSVEIKEPESDLGYLRREWYKIFGSWVPELALNLSKAEKYSLGLILGNRQRILAVIMASQIPLSTIEGLPDAVLDDLAVCLDTAQKMTVSQLPTEKTESIENAAESIILGGGRFFRELEDDLFSSSAECHRQQVVDKNLRNLLDSLIVQEDRSEPYFSYISGARAFESNFRWFLIRIPDSHPKREKEVGSMGKVNRFANYCEFRACKRRRSSCVDNKGRFRTLQIDNI